ncbi:hypothetical protein [Parashewanella tropica]|uniref:hypothetical protein n=1 Tax=Parashewanella tropica TaxID=2547970 RepID=UPI00105A28A9|nr:hypothetical protein [Parashewanella tropica]
MSAIEAFSIIKDICLAVAAVTTAYVAYTGLEKWQKELRGKANFEVARELIKSIYKLRDELSYCRSPFILASEFPENYKGSFDKHSDYEEGQAWSYVYSKRWEPVGEAVQKFDTAVLEAEALWGTEIKDKALKLRKCVRNLQVDIEAVINDKYSGGEHFQDRDFANKVRASVSDSKSKDNELTNKINAAIDGLESEIRPHLSRC